MKNNRTCYAIGVGGGVNVWGGDTMEKSPAYGTDQRHKARVSELVDKCMAILNNNEYGVVIDVLDELQAEVEMSRLVARGREG